MNKNVEVKVKNLQLHSEKKLESKLIRVVRAKNGACIKIQGIGNKGMPDRLCLLPGGKVWFVELKKPGKKPDNLQLVMHQVLRNMGFSVFVVSNEQELKQFENGI